MRTIDKYVKGSTAQGQRLVESGSQWIGDYLYQVYNKWSSEKQRQFDSCYETYAKMDNSVAFGICSKNTYGFTCSWVATLNDENVMIFCTKSHTYCIYLDKQRTR